MKPYEREELEALIPISLELDSPSEEQIVACIREQHEKYGFRKFLLAAPGGGWRSKHYPPRAHFTERAQLFRRVKERLSPLGLTCGWWITATMKSGRDAAFSAPVRADGGESAIANCPADPAFRERFCADVRAFVEIARPACIMTEDDFSIRAATFGEGCFCKHHLALFAEREGRAYTREELCAIFAERTEDSYALLRRFRALMRDTLVEFSTALRAAVDTVAPEIPIGYMQAGGADWDGDCTDAVCRAMAGEHHAPFSRLYGCFYCGGRTRDIPFVMYHPLYFKQHLKNDFLCYHESDTFPHTRFFTSAAQMRAMMSLAYSYGFAGSTFQTQQLLDDPNEEDAYGAMYAAERARWNEVYRTVRACRMKGVQIDYDPFWNTADPSESTEHPLWTRVASSFGIPYVTVDSEVKFWDARQARHKTDAEIREALAGKELFLDGDAARVLTSRGYGVHLGVSVGERDVAEGSLGFDLGAREVLREGFYTEGRGKHMPSAHMYAVGRNGRLLEMRVSAPTCEVISELYTFDGEYVSPAMTRFRNSLGGCVIVMGMTLDKNESQSLFNYRRKRLFETLVIGCADSFVLVKDAPDVTVVMNEATDAAESGFFGMLTLINLGDDPVSRVALHLPPAWAERKRLCTLDAEGHWMPIGLEKTEDGIEIDTPLLSCEPLYLRFE